MTTATGVPNTIDSKVPVSSSSSLRESIRYHLRYTVGVTNREPTSSDALSALAFTIRERLIDGIAETEQRYQDGHAKRLYYLSMEFLVGQSLENNLRNLGLYEETRSALAGLGFELSSLADEEPDAGLGNGGLGRLAACFLDSLATLGMPGYGYGINYEYGLFRQLIKGGVQRETPDNWMTSDTPWLIERPDEAVTIPLYGHIEHAWDVDGNYHPMWSDWQQIIGVPNDLPIVGYGGQTINTLRLFSARAPRDFDMATFNTGDFQKAVEDKVRAETISKVLYPSDAIAQGKELRLIQEYFLVACAVRDLARRFEETGRPITEFADAVGVQLNDTHPAMAVAELMRFLVDQKAVEWDQAWEITQQTCAYTNHTLLPEALERWPVALFERVLPRHLQIIFEINHRFLKQVSDRWPGDVERLRRVSIIDEEAGRQVRMCNLSVVGSHSVNGVSAMHSELVKETLLPEFNELWPERFNNKTNGITPRRWLVQCNPELTDLIHRSIGDNWVTNLDQLELLNEFAGETGFQDEFLHIKKRNKARLAAVIKRDTGIAVDPDSLFDVQVKRIHEYKRQLLNCLHVIHDYFAVTEDGWTPDVPRTYVFSGKAAPGYWAAKQIIRLINQLGKIINTDPCASQVMRVVFLPNYRVSLAERIFPASDLSEQISTAGYEASGTGNMKFMLNGAITMGTLDGANVEMLEEVGHENMFIFGKNAEEVAGEKKSGSYRPYDIYERNPQIRRVVDSLNSTRFCPNEPGLFEWMHQMLLQDGESYYHLGDLESYLDAQYRAGVLVADRHAWAEKAIRNVAASGKFSSDRTIREYASDIWGIRSF